MRLGSAGKILLAMKRRNFIKTSAAGAVAAPTIIPSTVLGKDAPSNKITLGLIGCGGQGTGNMRNLMNQQAQTTPPAPAASRV